MIFKKIIRRITRSTHQSKRLWREGNPFKSIVFFGSSLAKLKYPLEVSINGQRTTIRPGTEDFGVVMECLSGEFEKAIQAASPLRYGLIIDAGGYIGTGAVAFARAFPDARVVTIEPSRDNFKILCRNVSAYPNITVINKALGRSEGSISLVSRGTGEWGFSIVQTPTDCASPRMLHDVEITTIPAILKEFQKDGIDLLKLDIEGGEYDLLSDQPAWLQSTRVIFAELHERIVPGCEELFKLVTANRRALDKSGEKVLSVLVAPETISRSAS
jgi:FkbM family methyltransferase